MKFVMEGTQSERINFSKCQEDSNQRKTVLVFQDVDSVLPDEAGFYSGLIKCIENSKVPIIMTSHKPFESSEIISRCNKKLLKIKNILVSKSDTSAMKIKIRLHIIILFECIINKHMNEFFANNREDTETEIKLDLDSLGISEDDLNSEEISSLYPYLTTLLKQSKFNITKWLSLLDVYTWETVTHSIDQYASGSRLLPKRNDLLFKQELYASSNPNMKLGYELFMNVLPELEYQGPCKKEEWSSTEGDSRNDTTLHTPTKNIWESNTIEAYQKYIENLSHFYAFNQAHQNFEENVKTRNICDVNINNLESSQVSSTGDILDEFFLGPKLNKRQSCSSLNVKKCRGKNSDQYDKYMTTTTNSSGMLRMSLGEVGQKNDSLPYFPYISKEGCLNKYKRNVNWTDALYGSLSLAQLFHSINIKVLFNKIENLKDR